MIYLERTQIKKIAVLFFLFTCLILSYSYNHWLSLTGLLPILLRIKLGEELTLVLVMSVTVAARDLPFDQLIPLLYLLQFKKISFSRHHRWIIAYLFLILLNSFIYLAIYINNYKVEVSHVIIVGLVTSFASAITWYLILSNWKSGVETLFRVFALSAGIIFMSFIFSAGQASEEYALLSGVDQFIIYTLPYFYFSKRKFLFLFSIIFFAIVMSGKIFPPLYISSFSFGFLILAFFLSYILIINHKKINSAKTLSAAIILILSFPILFTFISYERLTNIGMPPLLAYKVTQPINNFSRVMSEGLNTTNASDVLSPSLLARYISLVNTLERPLLFNAIGSGLFSFYEETKISWSTEMGKEYDETAAYSYDQIASGQFYRPHNTPRGLLHYGIVYFLIVTVIYLRVLKRLRASKANTTRYYFINILFLNSLWNPYIHSLVLLAFSGYFLKYSQFTNKKNNDAVY